MDNDPLQFLSGNPAGEQPAEPDAPQATEAADTAPDSAAERPRGPDGKFAPKDASTPPQPPLSEKETVGFYKAMQEERDKRQGLEKQLADFKARETPAEPVPFEAQFEARLYAQNLKTSRRFAETQYGKDEVAKVHDWAAARCDADPVFNQQMRSSDHPYEEAMLAFNRDQIVSKVTPERLAAFEAWEAAQSGSPATPLQPASAPPPRSLADASGTGGMGKAAIPVHEGAAFAALPFNKG